MKDAVYKRKEIIHVSFEIGLLLKGLYGLIEIVGGALLLFLNPNRMNGLTRFLTRHELSEDPKDIIANLLINFSSGFSISAQHFAVFYLISHGVIKCILILLLWRKKLWAYPLTIVTFIVFIAYQIYRYTLTQSVFLVLLTVFDIVMIVLAYFEYKGIKSDLKVMQ